MSRTRVLAAMSGGVDSSVAAALAAQRGDEVVGVTMKLLPRGETGFGCCGSPADVDDARRVCEKIGIPHYVVDMADLFESKVIRPFVESYLSGRTPNPCVECNRSVKFGHLLGLAEAWGCARVATGHYARVEGGRLLKSVDAVKDQTYFLYALTARELSRVEFPVGGATKDAVRAKARALGLKTADKPESMETCFVPARDVRGFVAARPEAAGASALSTGEIRDVSGRRLGAHPGVASYTVGQRKGLGLSSAEPLYVVSLDARENVVVVGGAGEEYSAGLTAAAVSWTGTAPAGPRRAEVRVRHRHAPAAAEISVRPDGSVTARFDVPQRAVAPGQAAVFYDGDEVLGGGTIVSGGAES
ncbi:MAG: tRNA 2-thiouridine(34) synthase MnmA [Elusimicrobia bacterium]|nr:tRNA 2-thiouridine(34) synthase MnmA [Elusimicrobiota bacterium]